MSARPTLSRHQHGAAVLMALFVATMCCAVSGQGAGVAAAVSLRTGQSFDRLDIGSVQQELKRQGARIR